MTTGDVIFLTQVPLIMARMEMARSLSPKAVISESSPIKKRRVDGFCNVDYRHRRGSRSGDLALLRVLSAPLSPLNASSPPNASRSRNLPACRPRPRPNVKLYLLDKTVESLNAVLTVPDSLHKTIELEKKHFVFPKAANRPRIAEDGAMDWSSIKDSRTNNTSPSDDNESIGSNVIQRAEELAGSTAMHFKQIIPPKDEDAIASFFNPEPLLSSGPSASPQSAGLLPSPITSNASLKERLDALPSGESLVFVYPTQRGASMFIDDILTPVLDPLMRRTVNGHGLPDETAKKIRHTSRESLACMMDYEELKETCEDIILASNQSTGGSSLQLHFARKAVAQVPAAAWKSAWIEQQRDMVREAIGQGLQARGGGASVDYSGIAHPKASLRVAEELLTDLKKQTFEQWEKPERNEVEVGVFVIRRQ